MRKCVIDTNVLLDSPDIILKESCVIPSTVFSELENIKISSTKGEEVKYKARQAIRFLNENTDKFQMFVVDNDIYDIVTSKNLPHSNDNLILACAYKLKQDGNDVVFISSDGSARFCAQSYFSLIAEKYNDILDEYKGYTKISGNSDYINDYISNIDYSNWAINQYLVVHNTDDNKNSEMRFDGKNFVSLKLPPSNYVKARNSLQRCALDLMMSKDITIVAILGGYGSGKTYLATQMALYNVVEKGNQSKILGIRECSGEGREVGFLKGTFEDKTGRFFKPLEQQLKGGEFEFNSLVSRGVLETNIPFYLKGTTYNETIFLVDEAEDLTEAQIKLIGTRLGENSKIYFSGDYNQSLVNKTLNNPLVKVCNELKGNPMFGCIILDDDVRSETSKIFADLFKQGSLR